MKKLLAKEKPLLTAIVTIAICYASIKLLSSTEEPILGGALLRLLLSALCVSAVYLISGTKSFEHFGYRTGYVLRKFGGFLIFAAVMGLLYLGGALFKHQSIVEDWPKTLVYTVIELIFIGLFEELCFRVVPNDALIYRFRERRSIFVWIAVISSLLFGWVHVAGASLSSPMAVAQAVLKTLSCALFGLALLILYWKTRNIWGIALAHACFDGLPLIPTLLFGGEVGGYVTDAPVEGGLVNLGYVQIGLYALETVVEIFFLIRLLKVLRSIDFDALRNEW